MAFSPSHSRKIRARALQKETQALSYLHRYVHFWCKVSKEAQVREAERKFSQERLILNYYIYIRTRNAMPMCFHLILLLYCGSLYSARELRSHVGKDLGVWSGLLVEHKGLHPPSACLARAVTEVPGFSLFLTQASQELLLPWEKGGTLWLCGTPFPRTSLSWSWQAPSGPAAVTLAPSSPANASEEKPSLFLVAP